MNEFYYILAIFAVVFICVLLVTVGRRRKMRETAVDLVEDDFGETSVLESASAEEGAEDVLAKDILNKKYSLAAKPLNIPSDAKLVHIKIAIFDTVNRDIVHYCWISSKSLMFFPQWESVEVCFHDCAVERYKDEYSNAFIPRRIPRGSVGYWRALDDKSIELCYAPARGEKDIMILPAETLPLLATLMPDRELSYIMKNIYPKSSQNISDMSSEHKKLKERLANGEITQEEYEKGKMYIFSRM